MTRATLIKAIHAAKRRGILDNPTKAGLRSFCAAATGLKGKAATDPAFLTVAQCIKVVEALVAMIERSTPK